MPVDHFCSITPTNNRDFAQVTLELWWAIPTKRASVGHYTWQCGSILVGHVICPPPFWAIEECKCVRVSHVCACVNGECERWSSAL